jgi:hypothetical protein
MQAFPSANKGKKSGVSKRLASWRHRGTFCRWQFNVDQRAKKFLRFPLPQEHSFI